MAPTALTASAVAMKVLVGTITSSPGPMPSARRASSRAVGAGGDADRVLGLAVGGELALEGLDLGAEGEGGVAGDPLDHLEQLRDQLRVGGVEADEGDAAPSVAAGGSAVLDWVAVLTWLPLS